MANFRNLEKLASIDAQLRLLVPGKVSEDDKLIEYDALLLDRFLDILQDLHGEDLKETVNIIELDLPFVFVSILS
jgi:phosphoenolpyruvate carboxylase